MKAKLIGFFGLIAVAISQIGCSNEVEVIGIWKDIPVVYGIIDATKDTNYIRIERAYLPPNKSALVVAKNQDSIYFDPSDVEIKMYKIGGTDTIPWPTPFVRVDLAAEGITRDSGLFAHSPAYAYRLIGRTRGKYHLVIKSNKTNRTFRATTESINITSSNGIENVFITIRPSYTPNTRPISFVKKVAGKYQFEPYLIDITPNLFATIFDLGIRFNYKEYQIDGLGAVIAGSMQDKVLDWKAARNYVPDNKFNVAVTGEEFFKALQSKLSDITGTNTRRCGGYIEVYVDGASRSLSDYIAAINANKGASAGLHPVEPYSNVTGGYGILAASNRLEKFVNVKMQMSSTTFEYLADGELTQKLGFQNSTSPCY